MKSSSLIKKVVVIAGCCIGSAVLIFVALNLYVYWKGAPYIKTNLAQVPTSEVVIIPGAAILKNNTLSPILKERADAALELYQAKKVSKILVTGADPTLSDDEVSPVRRYLVKEGVSSEDIFVDYAGFNTYSSMYRAHAIFQVTSAIVVSQRFHLPRAIYIARGLGINAYGFSADDGRYLFKNNIRELFARPYAFFKISFKVKPKYLGASFPIGGDGEATWGN